MKKICTGKTKDVYARDDGNYVLHFKDDVTGTDGTFDPGADTVGLSIDGMGVANLRLTTYFFEMIQKEGILSHYISSDLEKATMVVYPATVFGKGIEVICRFRSTGSFMRRYGAYATEGQELDALVEITLKDDQRHDPLITKDALVMLGILTANEYEQLKQLTQQIARLMQEDLSSKGLDLYDMKFEFGKIRDGEIALIDEISAGSMRVYKDGKSLKPLQLTELILQD